MVFLIWGNQVAINFAFEWHSNVKWSLEDVQKFVKGSIVYRSLGSINQIVVLNASECLSRQLFALKIE